MTASSVKSTTKDKKKKTSTTKKSTKTKKASSAKTKPVKKELTLDDYLTMRLNVAKLINSGNHTREVFEDYLTLLEKIYTFDKDIALGYLRKLSGWLYKKLSHFKEMTQEQKDLYYNTHKRVYRDMAYDDFESFMIYIEWDRPIEKQFYFPRRKQLKPIVEALQALADGLLDVLAISMPPGTGKTSLALFFLAWIGGKNPDLTILGGSHSNSFLRGCYDELLRIMDRTGEYLYGNVFPGAPIFNTNAKDMRIDLQRPKRFETFEFSSIGSGNAGKVRASNLLYCDDLVDGIETAMSIERLDKLWQMYTADLRQRKIGNCKELHIATRWSVHDVIGRLQNYYEGNDRAKFITFPALNEKDESNFDYPFNLGFTTEFYHEQREILDDASWKALYMNEPIEREGLLYTNDQLRHYFELPAKEPDAIIAVCDTKGTGSDYCVLPVAYQYGQDFYIEDILCDNSNPDIVDERLIQILCKHKVQMARFESNNVGSRVAKTVQEGVKARGGITKITTKTTTANKETKIIVHSPYVLEHFLFKDESVIKSKEYSKAISMLCSYTMAGKNKHDDVPDAMAQLSDFCQSLNMAKVEVFKRPF